MTYERKGAGGGGGGVTDHGLLTGLGDNDHPQYASNPGVDLYTAEPQALVLDRVYTYAQLSADETGWYDTSDPLVLTANSNRALPAGTVGDVVGVMAATEADGVFVVDDMGEDGVSPWVLSRHPDFDTAEAVARWQSFPLAGGGSYTLTVTDVSQVPDFNGVIGTWASVRAHAEGFSCIAEGSYSHAEGTSSHAEGSSSHAEGYSHAEGNSAHSEGSGSHAQGNGSHAEGNGTHAEGYAAHAEGNGSHAQGTGSHSEAGGFFAAVGDAQSYRRVRRKATTNATPGTLTSGIGTDLLAANKTVSFTVHLIASRVGGTEQKAWQFRGAMTNVGGTPALVGAVISESWGTPTWAAAVTADTDGPRVGVTGEAAKTIRWVATIEQTEVGI